MIGCRGWIISLTQALPLCLVLVRAGSCRHGSLSVSGVAVASAGRTSRCIAPGFLDTRLLLGGGPHDGLVPGCSGIMRTAQAILLDEPVGVVTGDEVADRVTDLV